MTKYQIISRNLFLSCSLCLAYIHAIQYHCIFDVDICALFLSNVFLSSDWCDVSVKTGSHLQHVVPRSTHVLLVCYPCTIT